MTVSHMFNQGIECTECWFKSPSSEFWAIFQAIIFSNFLEGMYYELFYLLSADSSVHLFQDQYKKTSQMILLLHLKYVYF